MSCDSNMRAAAKAAAASGISPILSKAAYQRGVSSFRRKQQIYKEMLTYADAETAQEFMALVFLGEKPRRKKRGGRHYFTAGVATAVVLTRQKRARKRLEQHYEKMAQMRRPAAGQPTETPDAPENRLEGQKTGGKPIDRRESKLV